MLLSFFSCGMARHKMPKMPLVSVCYRGGSQMNPYPSTDITVFSRGDSVYAVSFDSKYLKYGLYHVTEPDVMDTLRTVIREHKMYRYDDHYYNKYVLDGDFWYYEAKFSDGAEPEPNSSRLSSSGSNAGPRNAEGLVVLPRKLRAIVQAAEFLYVCDENGVEITDVPEESSPED